MARSILLPASVVVLPCSNPVGLINPTSSKGEATGFTLLCIIAWPAGHSFHLATLIFHQILSAVFYIQIAELIMAG